MNLPELTEQSLSLLRRILEQAHSRIPEADPRWAFIFRHGRNICELGDDILFLERQNRSRSSRILVRPMMESLFNLGAAVQNSAFPAEKYVAELEEYTERIKKWVAADQPGALQAEIDKAERRAHDTRRQYSIKAKNKWSVVDTAREAGLDYHYRRDYVLYSEHIHSTNGALISSERQLDRELVLTSVIFIVLKASENIASATEAGIPRSQRKEMAKLWKAGIELIKS